MLALARVRPRAALTSTWMGGQSDATPVLAGSFRAEDDSDFRPTEAGSKEEIIAGRPSGGIGRTDRVATRVATLALMDDAGLIDLVAPSRSAARNRLIPAFTGQPAIRAGDPFTACRGTGLAAPGDGPAAVPEAPASSMDSSTDDDGSRLAKGGTIGSPTA